ncbi:hypothetical protein DPMN_073892 [Dreissena polymorpha]|uniref:Uncharacterized protein n=1 Tax=Dreissena polymorpha TaxID=45954 RepID=A0A9D3YF94_DREPO|nr:hypothetical protein DPMN_073892 [Dreissena polymorpha]
MLDSDDANNPPNDYSAPAASQVKQKRRHFRPAHRHNQMSPIILVLPASKIRFRHLLPSRSPKWSKTFQLLLYRSHHLMQSKSLHTLNSMLLCPLLFSYLKQLFLYETWLLRALPAAWPSCLHLSNWPHAAPTTTGTLGPGLPCTERNAIIDAFANKFHMSLVEVEEKMYGVH